MNEYESYEKDREIERLNKNIERLEELLSVSETQYASVEQIVAHLQDENKKLKEQIDEANEVIIYANNVADSYDKTDSYLKKWGLKL